jgi:hypothetical protein
LFLFKPQISIVGFVNINNAMHQQVAVSKKKNSVLVTPGGLENTISRGISIDVSQWVMQSNGIPTQFLPLMSIICVPIKTESFVSSSTLAMIAFVSSAALPIVSPPRTLNPRGRLSKCKYISFPSRKKNQIRRYMFAMKTLSSSIYDYR